MAADRHFVFLGYRDYDLVNESGEDILRVVPGSGLGILREDKSDRVSKSFATVTPEVRKLARAPDLLILTKANSRATGAPPRILDYVGVKRFDAKGQVFRGASAFSDFILPPHTPHLRRKIPLLRRKVNNVRDARRVHPTPHGKHWSQLEQYPRDELFQISEDELFEHR